MGIPLSDNMWELDFTVESGDTDYARAFHQGTESQKSCGWQAALELPHPTPAQAGSATSRLPRAVSHREVYISEDGDPQAFYSLQKADCIKDMSLYPSFVSIVWNLS